MYHTTSDKPLLPERYERSTFTLETIKVDSHRPAFVSGLLLLVGGLAALAFALMHIGSSTTPQAVAWAFVVAAVLAALRRWA